MKPKINYHYTISYKPIKSFEFKKYNEIVSEECYQYRVFPMLPRIVKNLRNLPESRQEVVTTHNNVNNACLISLQFQIVKKRLIVIANFRSQCKVNGRPYDTQMLRYFATIVSESLGCSSFKIYVNVGNYHINSLTKN
jgi:thymidylate synthase